MSLDLKYQAYLEIDGFRPTWLSRLSGWPVAAVAAVTDLAVFVLDGMPGGEC